MQETNNIEKKGFLSRHITFPFIKKLEDAYKTFSTAEKTIFLILLLAILIISAILFSKLYSSMQKEVPSKGGVYTEGIIGIPRFINPLLAVSDADRDLTNLIYSGLLKPTKEGGLIPDLAESYLISSDNRTFDFILKPNLKFHDDKPLTTADIEFTIKKAQDPLIKSQKKSAWDGVTVNVIDEKHIQFVLKQSYAPFLENATLGILPKHIWKDVNAEQFTFSVFNVEPVGSGPYKISKLKFDSARTPTEYKLIPFEHYTLNKPFISKLNIRLYQSEIDLISAFEDNEINAIGGIDPNIADEYAKKGFKISTAKLPRVFGVFFNQNQNEALLSSAVRQALNMSVDRNILVNEVLKGYGFPITKPYLEDESTETRPDIEGAKKILEKNGWVINTETGFREKKLKDRSLSLAFTIATGEKNDLKSTAEILKNQWKEIGADVSISVYENGDLNQNIIRPRKYDALLFGEIVGRDFDLYPFWHSSQRNDPGLNIALYANMQTDKLLEELRLESDKKKKQEILSKIGTEIEKDTPAIFIYSPKYIYIADQKTQAIDLGYISLPNERFMDIQKWYKDTNKVWDIFEDKN